MEERNLVHYKVEIKTLPLCVEELFRSKVVIIEGNGTVVLGRNFFGKIDVDYKEKKTKLTEKQKREGFIYGEKHLF